MFRTTGFFFALNVLAACLQPMTVVAQPVAKTALAPAVTSANILMAAEKLARLQLDQLGKMSPPATMPGVDPVSAAFFQMENAANPLSWHQAIFWLGMTRLADRTRGTWGRDAVLAQGRAAGWQMGQRVYHADDHLIGSSYLWAARKGAGSGVITPLRARFDEILARPAKVHLALHLGPEGMRGYPKAECLKRWCWADAVFMAPATWLELANVTGDARYRDFALAEYKVTSDFLYDPGERLFFRDSSFFEPRDEKGRKIFWSRGNGWALAGLARMIEAMPARHPQRPALVAQFREMATRVAELQRQDGCWSSALLDTTDTVPETSGTALLTYALAWGVTNDVLPRATFAPHALRGWQALTAAIQPDGKLGWVQPAGDRPGKASAGGSQVYASGAYLLAATAVSDLVSNR